NRHAPALEQRGLEGGRTGLGQHGAALGWQAGQCHHIARLGRVRILGGTPGLIREPPRQGFVAAIAAADGFLWLAVRRIGLATYADVEMCIMPPEGPDLAQPAPVAGYRFAQLLL